MNLNAFYLSIIIIPFFFLLLLLLLLLLFFKHILPFLFPSGTNPDEDENASRAISCFVSSSLLLMKGATPFAQSAAPLIFIHIIFFVCVYVFGRLRWGGEGGGGRRWEDLLIY